MISEGLEGGGGLETTPELDTTHIVGQSVRSHKNRVLLFQNDFKKEVVHTGIEPVTIASLGNGVRLA